MEPMTKDRGEIHRQFQVVDRAYRTGDLAALRTALQNPPDFPNNLQPHNLAVGDHPLEYAIYWSPVAFIKELLAAGADPNYLDQSGFPSLIAALSSGRREQHDIVRLLLKAGADVDQRGLNDWTALHCAVARRDLEGVRILLDHGGDPALRTRIDDGTSPLEDAQSLGFDEAAALLRTESPSGHKAET